MNDRQHQGALLTVNEYAALCRVSPATIYRAWARGEGPAFARIGRNRRIPRSELPGQNNEVQWTRINLSDLDSATLTPTQEVACLLEEAASIARKIVDGRTDPGRWDSVAWRAADALLVLQGVVQGDIAGLSRPTGRGARICGGEPA